MNVVGFLAETIQRHIVRILSVVVLISTISQSVPPNYCFLPLNTTDCKGPPTPVFYYYKPGSRCEIGIWRGCPTQNKFPDEVLCVHTCIARFIAQADSRENQVMEIKIVTTPKDEVIELPDWENQLNQITLDEADDLIIILDEIVEQKPKPQRTKLKHTLATVKTTGSELISEIHSSAIEEMPTTETASEKTTFAETTPTDSTTEDTFMTDSTIEDATTTDFTKEDTTITDSTTEDTIEETTVSAITTSTTTPFTTPAASTTPSSTTTTTATTLSQGDADEVILIH